ncbi:MAG: DNA methyltransferase [Polyangiaceae bacterium]
MPEMAPEAMDALASSVRRLRTLLETDLSRQLDRRFRLSVPSVNAGLEAKELALRTRLEGWLAERARARHSSGSGGSAASSSVASTSLESDMASTALLRLFLLRQLEACGVSRPPVLSGGWSSKGYLEFRSFAPGLTDAEGKDDFEGLDFLLKLLFEELAVELPGLYGEQPLDAYFTLSPAALRELIAVLNAPELASAWQDDTMLGWVYQFWNDPQREAIDQRVGPRGKVLAQEIASKTQLFTEQYMVEWLLENSLGRIALAMRDARAARLTSTPKAPPPWPMFVLNAASLNADELPATLSELKLLDPACGSGHFLAGAFDLLVPLYREEARDNGVELPDAQIADNILRHNLHGIDIDSRAVQVAAAVLYLKARRLAPRGHIPPLNLVSTAFDLDGLADDDPALAALARALPNGHADVAEAVRALRHVGVRGSLMRFQTEQAAPLLFEDLNPNFSIERLLTQHTSADDLGVRFDGTQLAAGLRLQRILVDGRYDVVVLNPPYLATSKIDLPSAVLAEAFGDAPDLFAAFVQRAFELCKPTGLMAFVALSNWMFLSSFQDTRERMLAGHILLLADVGKGAFRRASKLIQSAMVVASPKHQPESKSFAARVGSRDAISPTQTFEIASELRDQASYTPFDPSAFARVEGAPLLFWLDPEFMRRYAELPKIEQVAECKGGIATSNNERFLRAIWEVPLQQAKAAALGAASSALVPYLKGAEGREWIEPFRWVLRAEHAALELRVLLPSVRVEPASLLGVAYTTIGHRFGTRLHTVASVRDVSGASVFPTSEAVSAEALVCALNRSVVRELASALNPTVNFQVGDVRRLPFDAVDGAAEIVAALRVAFARHERASELSTDYCAPGPTAWRSAQIWAQSAVDRRRGEPMGSASFAEELPESWLAISHGLGIALGRFASGGGIASEVGGGLPDGILLLGPQSSGLEHEACAALRAAWAEFGRELDTKADLASYLRKSFFAAHRSLYEGRPIHWPLSSAKRAYVAYVCMHSLRSDTLSILLAEHLLPEKRRVEGELADLRGARPAGRAKDGSEKRFTEVQKLLEELDDFIAKLTELADKGPPPADSKTTPREVDARYAIDLEDGVLVNSAALWPVLEPHWKEPKKWWQELANAEGKQDWDWCHLAARYFPTRVRQKCHADPSLAVAQHCFWELHPAQAYAWELRLQHEIRPDFSIDEPTSDAARAKFLAEHAPEVRELLAKELKRQRREKSNSKADEEDEPLFHRASDEPHNQSDG